MLAVLCRSYGGPESLDLTEVPAPSPGPGQVRIRVHAAGVNFADTLMIRGKYQEKPPLPLTPGLEVAGVVDALGPGVTAPAVGTRVLALTDQGGFAEQVVAQENDVVPIPDHIDDVVAAGFAIAYGTSYGALVWRAALRPGETLLVHGAAGGVGLTAVECGRALGATVIATARGLDRTGLAKEHGATMAFDSEDPDLVAKLRAATKGNGMDVAYDPVGGTMFQTSLRTIAWEGRLLVIGFASGEIPQIPANILLVKNATVHGFYWGSYRRRDPARFKASFAELFEWLAAGRIRPLISHRLPLAQASKALELLEKRRATGKVVLTLD